MPSSSVIFLKVLIVITCATSIARLSFRALTLTSVTSSGANTSRVTETDRQLIHLKLLLPSSGTKVTVLTTAFRLDFGSDLPEDKRGPLCLAASHKLSFFIRALFLTFKRVEAGSVSVYVALKFSLLPRGCRS